MRKSLFQLHRWLGVHVSLLLFVICFTGSLATLGYQIEAIVDPGWSAPDAPMNWGAAEATLAKELPREWVAALSAPAESGLAAVAAIDGPRGQRRIALVDPGTGALKGLRSSLGVQAYLRQFHKALLLPRGLIFYGAISFVLLFFAVSGLVVYRSWWAHLFQLRLRDNPRVRWADIHRTVGVWVSLFAILAAVTSAWYLVDTIARPSYGPGAAPLEVGAMPSLKDARRVPLAELVKTAEAKVPGFEVRSVRFQYRPQDPVCTYGQSGAQLKDDHASEVCLDPYSGAVTHVRLPKDLRLLAKWKHTADELHYGSLGRLGGRWSKLLYFVLGMLLSLVVLAGPMLAAVRARASGRRPERNLKTALGVLVMLYSGALLAGAAAFTVTTLRRPTGSVGEGPRAVSEPVSIAGAKAIVARYGEGDYVVHWHGLPPPLEKMALVPEAGEPMNLENWRRPSARGDAQDRLRFQVQDFAGTATTSAVFALSPTDGPAPFGLSEPPTKVAAVVKGTAGGLVLVVALAGLVWLWILWRPIFFARKPD